NGEVAPQRGATGEWRGPDSKRRHPGFQPSALPAELPRPLASASLAGRRVRPDGGEALDERVDELALLEHRVGAGLGHGLVQGGVGIARERDETEVRMFLPQ